GDPEERQSRTGGGEAGCGRFLQDAENPGEERRSGGGSVPRVLGGNIADLSNGAGASGVNMHNRDIAPALPDAVEAEQALLGALLVNNQAYWTVAGFLKPMHFGEPVHQTIFETAG